ncbi:MAG: hypothetical protein ACBR20_18835 [Microcoleus sp.]
MQKNKTPVVILSLLMTIAILGTAIWWFTRSSVNLPTPSPPPRTLPKAPTPKPPSSSLR